MKVLLVNPSTGFYIHPPTSPLGLLSIGTYLKANGHDVIIIDRTIKLANYKKIIDTYKPDLVGISLISLMGVSDMVKISAYARKKGIKVFAGGHVPSEMPEVVLSEELADYVILSEGEETVLELVNAIAENSELSVIDGLVYMCDGKLIRNKDREFADLARFNIDWSLINPEEYYQSYYCCSKMLYMYTSKGCPFNCAFCFNPDFHRSCRRTRDLNAVLDEIEGLIRDHGLDGVYFCDELFCSTRQELVKVCDIIKNRHLDFVWGCEARINQYSVDEIRAMYEAGCRWIMFGIESGSDDILKKMHKGINREMIVETIDICNSLGITVVGSFVIGYPGETEEDLRSTCRLAIDLDINLYSPNHFMPAPHSEVSDELIAQGKAQPIRSLKKMAGIESVEHVYDNYSAVPSVDLQTVRAFFCWVAFSQKNVTSKTKNFALAKKSVVDALKNAFRYGVVMAVPRCLVAGGVFLSYLWHANVHRSVMKKYGLSYSYKKQRNRELAERFPSRQG